MASVILIISITAVAIVAFAGVIVMISAGIRREDRRGTFTLRQQAPTKTCNRARKATGVGVRWA